MKVIEFRAENFKGLKVVEIAPEGNVVQITGRNGQGKTSVLDGIWAALSGRFAASLDKPIRAGEDKASVTVTTDDLVITRTWNTEGRPSLRVENREGKRFTSPQAVLDALVAPISFDPLAFVRQSSKEQRETLLSMVELGYNPEEMEARIKEVYSDRTLAGRDLKAAQGAIDEAPMAPEGTPDQEVDTSELLRRIKEADLAKQTKEKLRGKVALLHERFRAAQDRARDLEDELEKAREQMEDHKEALRKGIKDCDESPDVDTVEIERQLELAGTINANVRAKRHRAQLEEKAVAKQAVYDKLTATLEALAEVKKDALDSAKFPVKGLGFDDEGVTYFGIPFSQASGAEQLKVSMGIAMALNPELRVVRIVDGSLLDDSSMEELKTMADEKDYQVWIERVDSSGKIGVVLEDGEVKSA